MTRAILGARGFTLPRCGIQIVYPENSDVNSLGAINTCCAGAFTLFRVQIAGAISRTGVPVSPTADAKQKTPPL